MKIINTTVKYCDQCPYCYILENSGGEDFICNNSDAAITDGYELFHSGKSHIEIPSWCKLKNVDEKLIIRDKKLKKIISNI